MAARYAKDAAHETRRGADTAENAVAETKRIGEAQVSAYLGITSATLQITSDGVILATIVVHNSGQSPARDFRWHFGISLRVVSQWLSTWQGIDQARQGRVFMAGEEYAVTDVNGELFGTDTWNGLKKAGVFLIQVRIVMEWKNVFNQLVRETALFRAEVRPDFTKPIPLVAWSGLADP